MARTSQSEGVGRLRARIGRVVLIGAIGGLVWALGVTGAPAQAAGGREVRRSDVSGEIDRLTRAAEASIERGTLREADALLRRAVALSARDGRAPAMLRALHDRHDFKLPVDDEAVREALAKLGPGYRVTETRHFVVVSDCDAAWRRRREALLERTYHEVMRFGEQLNAPVYPPEAKLLCVMMHDHSAYEAFARGQDAVSVHWVAGYYAGASNRVVLYNDATNPALLRAESRLDALESQAEESRRHARKGGAFRQAHEERAEAIERMVEEERERLARGADVRSEAKTIHEAAHQIAFNCGLHVRSRRYPMWITEGLATNFETDNPERSFGPDRRSEEREEQFDRTLAASRIEPLSAFLGRLRASSEAERADVEYAQSYALFRYLARFHRAELGALLVDIASEPPGEISGVRHVELFVRRFGPVGTLERKWLRWEAR